MDIVILISGRGSNMEALATSIKNGRISARIKAVISNKHQAPGINIAQDMGIPTFIEENMDDLAYRLRELAPDLVCLAGFMRLLPKDIIDRHTIINIHPALLPLFPGLRAQEQALSEGAQYSGCTVHFVDSGVDTGPIIMQDVVHISPDDTTATLSSRILEREHLLYSRVVNLFARGVLR